MGKVLAGLATRQLPRASIFGDRFVIECCETFHIHYKNLRFDLEPDDFERFADALRETLETWEAEGRPASHPHLELGRARLDVANTSDELSIELCENPYKQWPTGWDSRFHREDSFVHLHWRDLRLEMSNGEFLEFARVVEEAARRLESWKLKTLAEVFELLDREGIIYAVMRNWEHLPDRVETGSHSDLDLLVHADHVPRFDALLDARPTSDNPLRVQRQVDVLGKEGPSFILTDVRSPGDRYFPDDLAYGMLSRRIRHRGFWVLSPQDYLIGLAYHVVHHKGFATADYQQKLSWLADRLQIEKPEHPDCTAYAVAALESAGVKEVEAVDPTVRPVLPLLEPRDRIVSSRFLAVHQGMPIFSRVYVTGDGPTRSIRKQTTGTFARREFDVLRSLDSAHVPSVRQYREEPGHATFLETFVDGPTLTHAEDVILEWRSEDARTFVVGCCEMMSDLAVAGVRHRDIRGDNIMIHEGRPVLIDFGWAEADVSPFPEPENGLLGGEARAPEGGPNDAYSMGYVIRHHLVDVFPEFGGIADELMAYRGQDGPDWSAVLDQVKALEASSDDEVTADGGIVVEPGLDPQAVRLATMGGDASDLEFWEHYLEESVSLSLSMLHMVQEHYDAMAPFVGADHIRESFERAERLDDWIILHAQYLLDHGAAEDQRDFLAWIESEGKDPTVIACAPLAELCHRLGLAERADQLARFVTQYDPYFPMCWRIRATYAESQQRATEAREAWRQVVILRPDDAEARARLAASQLPDTGVETVSEEPTDLPEDPTGMVMKIREYIRAGKPRAATATARILMERAPELTSVISPLLEKIDTMGRAASTPRPRLIVDPLTDATYSEDRGPRRQQLEALVQTPLGQHPIIREELDRLQGGTLDGASDREIASPSSDQSEEGVDDEREAAG